MRRGSLAVVSAVVLLVLGWYYQGVSARPVEPAPASAFAPQPGAIESPPAQALDGSARPRDGQRLVVTGTVIRILADDRDGSPHQRFIIRADAGNTLLIAHNIDLAPRLSGLAVGDRLTVAGEFASNSQGGVIHWTHRDPAGRHVPGFIEWRGRRYQ